MQFKKNNIFFKIFLVSTLCLCWYFFHNNKDVYKRFFKEKQHSKKISTIYGSIEITEPVLLDIFDSKAMQRIKQVHQYGHAFFVKYRENPKKLYTRYEHSIGVWFLLRKFGASLEEQIAGLLHDASHTVFSHVGDYLFKKQNEKDSYQDGIHEWYLRKTDVPEILEKHGMSLKNVLHKDNGYKMLEQNLPALCADRIEYNLYGGFIEGMLTLEEVQNMVQALCYEDGKWFFKDIALAKKFSLVPLRLSISEWGGPETFLSNNWMADTLQRAVDIQLLTVDDVHFSTDDVVWNKLNDCKDAKIQENLYKMKQGAGAFRLSNSSNSDLFIKTKFRGVDPFVKLDNELKLLSEADNDYEKLYASKKEKVARGWHVKVINWPLEVAE